MKQFKCHTCILLKQTLNIEFQNFIILKYGKNILEKEEKGRKGSLKTTLVWAEVHESSQIKRNQNNVLKNQSFK